MEYRVLYDEKVQDDLRGLDKAEAKRILDRIETYLVRDPRRLGRPLKGEFKGLWRYRMGDYRVIYRIDDVRGCIEVLRIGHRKAIYKK